MFGFISKKKLIKEAIRILLLEDADKAIDAGDFRFREGVNNGLSALCYRLGINITDYRCPAKTYRQELRELLSKVWKSFIGKFKPYFCE